MDLATQKKRGRPRQSLNRVVNIEYVDNERTTGFGNCDDRGGGDAVYNNDDNDDDYDINTRRLEHKNRVHAAQYVDTNVQYVC